MIEDVEERENVSFKFSRFVIMATSFDVAAVRKHFPALQGKQVYMDNAGGSQVLQEVIDSYEPYI